MLAVLPVLSLFATAGRSQTSLVFHADMVFSADIAGTVPGGPSPWVTATFQNSGAGIDGEGKVTLTLTAANLGPGEFVSEWDFNLDPAYDPSNLSFQPIQNATVGVNGIKHDYDVKKANGDGRYDINFDFTSSGSPGNRFTAGDILQYDITYLTGANPNDTLAGLSVDFFDFFSAPAGGSGPFKMAVHIQGIPVEGGGTTSVWATVDPNGVAVPEPSSYAAIVGAAIATFVVLRRWRAGATAGATRDA